LNLQSIYSVAFETICQTTFHLKSPVALEGAITREGLTYVEMARYNRTKN